MSFKIAVRNAREFAGPGSQMITFVWQAEPLEPKLAEGKALHKQKYGEVDEDAHALISLMVEVESFQGVTFVVGRFSSRVFFATCPMDTLLTFLTHD